MFSILAQTFIAPERHSDGVTPHPIHWVGLALDGISLVALLVLGNFGHTWHLSASEPIFLGVGLGYSGMVGIRTIQLFKQYKSAHSHQH